MSMSAIQLFDTEDIPEGFLDAWPEGKDFYHASQHSFP